MMYNNIVQQKISKDVLVMKRPMDLAYEYIKERILNGTFLPSQKLNESDLAKEIGVSRNTIKKALLKLEQEHLVQTEENKGATVKAYTLEEVLNYFEIREALEELIINSSTLRLSDEAIQKLETIHEQMGIYLNEGKFDDYSSLNKEFHKIIYEACSNQQAVEMVNMIKAQLMKYHLRTILVPGRNVDSYNEHKAILEALKNRDPEAAKKAMRTHIANIRKVIEENHNFLM